MGRQGCTEGWRGARSAPCICRPPRSAGNPRPPLAHTQHTQLSAAAGSSLNEGRAAGPYSPACQTRGPPAPASGAPPWQLSAANDCRRATGDRRAEHERPSVRRGLGAARAAPRAEAVSAPCVLVGGSVWRCNADARTRQPAVAPFGSGAPVSVKLEWRNARLCCHVLWLMCC